jgi:hypothetical protein
MRLRIAWPATLIALALLAGCVSIPTGGGVTTAEVDVGDTDNPLLSIPAPPAPDATAAEIVAGFLRAGRGPQADYRVAREYLTEELRPVWKPGARTLISATPIEPIALADNTWTVTINATAAVDSQGSYQTTSPGDAIDLNFGLVKDDDDQWRISSAPDGTVLPPDRFSSIFTSYRLYFFDPSFTYLVPDLRWYRSGPGVASRVVDGLLGGPGESETGVLFSAFPVGTQRDGDTAVGDGIATVPLSSDARAGTATAHRRMLQQLLHTLRTAASVRQVGIVIDGVELDVPDGGPIADSSYLVGNDPIGFAGGHLGMLSGSGVTPIPGIGTSADAVGALGGSIVSDARDAIALLTDAGVTMVRAGSAPAVIDGRGDLAVPSLDPLGYTWSVPHGAPAQLQAIAADGTVHDVAGMPPDGRVVSIDVSRDGARLLIALDTADGPRLAVAGIQRDPDLVPTALVSLVDLPIGSAALLDAAWVDGVTVVALTGGTLTSVDAYEIGGQHTGLGALNGGVAVVGGNTLDGTRVLDGVGNVLRPGGETTWQDTGIDASFLVTQQ